MKLKGLIQNSLNKAFTLVGDLAVDCILTEKVATGFSFTTNSVNSDPEVTKTVKCIVLNKSNPREVTNSLSIDVLFKSTDIDTPDVYDRAYIEGIQWVVVPPFLDNGYTIRMTLTRVG